MLERHYSHSEMAYPGATLELSCMEPSTFIKTYGCLSIKFALSDPLPSPDKRLCCS